MLKSSLSLCQDAGDDRGTALALHLLGIVAETRTDYTAATMYYDESLSIARGLADAALIRQPLYNLGSIAMSRGEPQRARACWQEALALARQIGDANGEASSLTALGFAARQVRALDEAQVYFVQALQLRRDLGDRLGVENVLRLLADLEVALGDLDAALEHAEESLAIAREVGHAWGIVSADEVLAQVKRRQGDFDAARDYAGAMLQGAQDLSDGKRIHGALWEFAAITAAAGNGREAITVFAAAETLRESIGFQVGQDYAAEMDAKVSAIHDQLGEAAFAAAWRSGAALSTEEAAAYVLSDALSDRRADRDASEQPPASYIRTTTPAPTEALQALQRRLTARELEVLRLLAAGHSNHTIAQRLVVSERTVEHHIAHIYRKLDLRGRVDAAAFALRHGLVEP